MSKETGYVKAFSQCVTRSRAWKLSSCYEIWLRNLSIRGQNSTTRPRIQFAATNIWFSEVSSKRYCPLKWYIWIIKYFLVVYENTEDTGARQMLRQFYQPRKNDQMPGRFNDNFIFLFDFSSTFDLLTSIYCVYSSISNLIAYGPFQTYVPWPTKTLFGIDNSPWNTFVWTL